MAYYKTIDGVKHDAELLEKAEKAVSGKGDGRIGLKDAQDLLAAVKDGNSYTDIEKVTMKYIRDNFKWTDEADAWFRSQIAKWAAEKR